MMDVFEAVRRGELTSREGADILRERRAARWDGYARIRDWLDLGLAWAFAATVTLGCCACALDDEPLTTPQEPPTEQKAPVEPTPVETPHVSQQRPDVCGYQVVWDVRGEAEYPIAIPIPCPDGGFSPIRHR